LVLPKWTGFCRPDLLTAWRNCDYQDGLSRSSGSGSDCNKTRDPPLGNSYPTTAISAYWHYGAAQGHQARPVVSSALELHDVPLIHFVEIVHAWGSRGGIRQREAEYPEGGITQRKSFTRSKVQHHRFSGW